MLGAALVLGMANTFAAGTTINVIDRRSGAPVHDALILDRSSGVVRGAGSGTHVPFSFPPSQVAITAPGYADLEVQVPLGGHLTAALEPIITTVRILDEQTDEPINEVSIGQSDRLRSQGPGQIQVNLRPGDELEISAPGYAPARVTANGGEQVARLRTLPAVIVTNGETGEPVTTAVVVRGLSARRLEADGAIPRSGEEDKPGWVMAPGYDRHRLPPSLDMQRVALRPRAIRALYLTMYAVSDQGLRTNVEQLLRDTEANAIVIDAKGDRGYLSYRSDVPLASSIGATNGTTIADIRELLRSFQQRGVYTIARIVVFKDDRLARDGPNIGLEVGVRDASTGDLWLDGEGLAWVDPFRSEVWNYNVALAEEAAQLGFDEIQFDYIRFPTDPRQGSSIDEAQFSQPATDETRVRPLVELLRRAHAAVRQHGAYLGIDTFGYTPWDDGDLGIGQALEYLAPHVDFICPMIYPSTFAAGLPGLLNFPGVVNDPYRTVFETVKRAQGKVEGHPTRVRPWLQYFDDYPWQTQRRYGAAEIRAQIRGAEDAGGLGWMLWDPSNRFDRGGLQPRRT
jgi:hypothetical protein